MGNRRQEISDEAERINESCELSFVQHFIVSKWWRSSHFVLGIVATVLATVSTALAFNNEHAVLTGILTTVVAILVGLVTFLKPKDHADLHHWKGVKHQQLSAKARMLTKIDAPYSDDEGTLEAQLKALSDAKFALDREAPATPGGIFYKLAKTSVEKGETQFRVEA